jgi:transposase
MALLMQIPSVGRVNAAVVIAEIGIDMTVFLSVHHLAAWAGVCPASHESAGKRRNIGMRHGSKYLRAALFEAAISGPRTRGSYFRDKYYRLKARRVAKRARLVIAHKILVAIWHMLKRRVEYRNLGEAWLDQLDQQRTARNRRRRLEHLGYEVTVVPRQPTSGIYFRSRSRQMHAEHLVRPIGRNQTRRGVPLSR